MFDRYTEKARRAIFFARYEASQFGSPTIESEHLLLGVVQADKVLVNRLFRPSGNIGNIREEIERAGEVRERISTSVDMPLSNECKRALAYAAEEAERFGHKHIGTEHLLLGLLREEKSFAAKLLNDRNVRMPDAREQLGQLEAVVQPSAEKASQTSAPVMASRSSDSLSEFGRDLTQQAMDGKLPPLIGREPEVQRIIQILSRLTRNSPVLVGEPGVGKKAIIYGVVHHILENFMPQLDGRRILNLDLAVIASGTKNRTRFEENLENIMQELSDGSGPILFIEGLHTLAQTQRFLHVVNVIKPGLLRGTVRCISTATPEEYRKTVEATRWLNQCFSVIEVKPATEADAIQVLAGAKERFEKFHGVTYTEEALEYAVFHANSHFADGHLPENAIDLMDEAGARLKLRQKLPDEVREWRKRTLVLQQRHDAALNNNEFEKASLYAQELKKEITNLEAITKQYNLGEAAIATVTRDDIEQIVAERTGLSLELLRQSRAEKR